MLCEEPKVLTERNTEPPTLNPESADNMEIDKVETPKIVGKTDPEAGEAKQVLSTPTQSNDPSKAPKKKRITPIAIT